MSMFDILTLIPGKKKKSGKGWWSFDAVCCHHKGHRRDDRSRGGIMIHDQHNWSYHCFNCNFKCSFALGRSISYKTKQLLRWLNIDDDQIDKWSFQSLQQRDLIELVKVKKQKLRVKFKETTLPKGEQLSDTLSSHQVFSDYIKSRGLNTESYPFLITPDEEGRNSNRIVIPYTFKNKVVGHISRYLDGRTPKYVKDQQLGYVFGYDFQKSNWEVCIVVEGIFDALSINGCALTHDTISDEQAELLRSLNRRIIVVPDLDKSGLTICDRALELGFHVSIPNWDEEIKDTNDAVVKYGKLPTIMSILQSATTSKIKVQMKRRKLDSRL